MRRPREPAPGECCGSGCTRCVWDIYYDELARFEEFIAEGGVEEEGTQSSEEEAINYIGSVVVKYIDRSSLSASTMDFSDEWERAEMHVRGFFPVEKTELVSSSKSSFSPAAPGINVVNLFTSAKSRTMLPGDVIEVLVPNSRGTHAADDVERLCSALHLNPCAWCELHRSPFVPEDNFPPWLPLRKPLTLGQLLSVYVDVSSSSYVLHQSFFESLLRIYDDSKDSTASLAKSPPDPEKVRLLEACASPETGPQLLRWLSKSSPPLCYPSLADVLEAFSFIHVPLDRLLEITGPLQTRKYSLANWVPASLAPSPLQVCVREVCARRSADMPVPADISADSQRLADMFNGVAEARSLMGTAAMSPRAIYVSFSLLGSSLFAQQLQSMCVSLCDPVHAKSLRSPVFLIGCGTGIAPLIAAVTQLLFHRTSSAAGSSPFACWVFYGARTKAELLYDDILREALNKGAIARYEYAISQEDVEGQHGRHVTDLMKHHRVVIADALRSTGQLFFCGPAKAMHSVSQFIKSDLLAEPDDDDSVQEQRLMFLKGKGQVSFDIWSTGSVFE